MATFLQSWRTYYLRSGDGYPSLSFDACGFVKVYLDSQSTANNTSTIKIYHYIGTYGGNVYSGSFGEITSSYRANNGSFGGSYQSFTVSPFTIMGGTGFVDKYVGVKTHTITHNADGTARLYVNGSFGSKTLSFNVALPTIPRSTTINSFTWAKASGAAGISRLTCNWTTAHSIDRIQYSLEGGSYTTVTGSGTSGNFSISSLTPNTAYSLKIKVRRADSQIETESSVKSATTYDIAKITSAPNNNVNMDNAAAITYTNPSGASLETSVYKTDWVTVIAAYRACSGTSYTFNFEPGEKTAFYNQIPSTKTLPLRFYLQTSDGLGNSWLHYVDRTFEVFNANPTFADFTYVDTNATTKAITKVDTTMIKGYSTPKLIVSTANKMVANKGATATSYSFESTGIASKTKAYSAVAEVNETLAAIQNASLTVKAIDSRGNQTGVTKTPVFINYSIPVITTKTISRANAVGAITTLTIAGTYTNWASTYTDVSNSIQDGASHGFKYRYKPSGGAWSSYIDLTLTTNTGGSFTYSGAINGDLGAAGFTTTTTFAIEVVVVDKLAAVTSPEIPLPSAQPLLWKLKSITSGITKALLGIGKKPDTTLPHGSIDVLGDAVVGGKLKVNGPIIGTGNDGQGSWNGPTAGTVTQVVDDTRAQHSIMVGKRLDNGARLYGIDVLDNYSAPVMRIYSGSNFLEIGADIKYNDTKLLKKTDVVTLYNNTTGTNGTVTLSETSANFDYIEVFYRNNDNLYSSLKVYQPNGKKITMRGALTASGLLTYIKEKNCLISGTSITSQDYVEYAIDSSGISNYNGSNNYIYITRVIGYR